MNTLSRALDVQRVNLGIRPAFDRGHTSISTLIPDIILQGFGRLEVTDNTEEPENA